MRVISSSLASDRHYMMPASYAHHGGRLMLPKPSDYTDMWEWKYILRGHGHRLAFPLPLHGARLRIEFSV